MKTPITNIKPSPEQIENFCQRWHITELVTFDPQFQRGLTETLQIKEELQNLFDRKIDLIVKAAIERSANWLRRQNILESAQVIYAKRY